jgi:hypothetical protein
MEDARQPHEGNQCEAQSRFCFWPLSPWAVALKASRARPDLQDRPGPQARPDLRDLQDRQARLDRREQPERQALSDRPAQRVRPARRVTPAPRAMPERRVRLGLRDRPDLRDRLDLQALRDQQGMGRRRQRQHDKTLCLARCDRQRRSHLALYFWRFIFSRR